jgi:integrase
VELLSKYETELRSRGNTEFHVERTKECIRLLLDATKTKTLDDLNASGITNALAKWRMQGKPNKRKRKPIPLSVERSNVYARAIKGFTRWLWVQRIASDDALASLKLLNASVDRRRKRRALTEDEISRLLKATAESGRTDRGKTWTFTPADREMLYVLAIWTGLRGSELASLTVSSFDLKAGTVIVAAAYSKRRREDVLPLHPSVRQRLEPWLQSKCGKVFGGKWAKERRQAKLLQRDLVAAEIDYVDELGRHVDFHALRHTFVTGLARNGVHPAKAQRLARHSTVTLTLGVYSHVETNELRDAIDSLPDA